jgi:hypothetical protein
MTSFAWNDSYILTLKIYRNYLKNCKQKWNEDKTSWAKQGEKINKIYFIGNMHYKQ